MIHNLQNMSCAIELKTFVKPPMTVDQKMRKTSKILVVDDETEIQRLIEQRLRKNIRAQEFNFLFATNALEALETLKMDRDIDVILTDINMPEMDGITLLEEVKKIDNTIGKIIMSAYTDMNYIRAAMNCGAFDFLSKPIDFRDLEITLKKILKDAQQARSQQYQLQQVQAQLAHNALHDSLTNLPNRARFLSLLDHQIKLTRRYPNYTYAVLFLDLDRFKAVNDNLGHRMGDELLKRVVERLCDCIRAVDTVARLGGDEFVILLESVQDIYHVTGVAQRIQEQLSQPFEIEGYEIHTGASIGITLSRMNYQHPDEILEDADTAMYRAKHQGRGCYAIFDPAMQARAVERSRLERDLRRAITAEEFHLHYQPIFAISDGSLKSLEVLVRWNSMTQGLIPPLTFIPIAEATGLITPLGWWVFQQACEQLSRWQQLPGQSALKLNLNLSLMQLKQTHFIGQIEQILDQSQLPGESLQLELHESWLLGSDMPHQVECLNQLKKLGVQLCIEDFGTGYSALSYFNEFPIDTLKLDRKFIRQIETNEGVVKILKVMMSVAHSLNLEVIAEGVETQEQFKRLQDMGCHYVQGYFLSQPIAPEAVHPFLQSNHSFQPLQSND